VPAFGGHEGFNGGDDHVYGVFKGNGCYIQSFSDLYKTYTEWMSINAPGKPVCSKKNLGCKLSEDSLRFSKKRSKSSYMYQILLSPPEMGDVSMDEMLIG
jgi:hypothetical protein